MFFVGNASSEAEAPSNDATAARKLTTVPAAQASPPRPPLGDAGARRRRLSPSDVFVLSQETGPGFVVIDDFLGGEGREAALSMSAAARSYDGLRPAGMGRGLGRWTAANKRGDEIAWLKRRSPEGSQTPETQRGGDSPPAVCEVSPSKSGAVLLEFLDQMESLRAELTDTWGLGADSTRTVATSDHKLRISKKMTHQLARYPGTGTGYVRHRDAYPAAPNERNAVAEAGGGRSLSRQLTAIYYLNSGWTPVAGGQLRLYLDHPASACGTAKSDQSRPSGGDSLGRGASARSAHNIPSRPCGSRSAPRARNAFDHHLVIRPKQRRLRWWQWWRWQHIEREDASLSYR